MKKAIILFTLLILILSFLFANTQHYYVVDSPEWQHVNDISHYAGVIGPTSMGPVSGEQLLVALNRAARVLGDNNTLISEMREVLTSDSFAIFDGIGQMDLFVELKPEIYLQSNPSKTLTIESDGKKYPYDADENWLFRPNEKRPSFTNFGLEVGILDYAYGYIGRDGKADEDKEGFFDSVFSSNYVTPLSGGSQSFPFDCGLSLGTKNFTLMVGKSRVSYGEGHIGNTAIGDNFNYQEFLKGGFFSDKIGVNLSITHFDSSFDPDGKFSNNPYYVSGAKFSGNQQLRHHEEFEITLFDKLRITFSLINMIDSSSSFDIRLLNPFYVLHSMFNYVGHNVYEGNNMLSFDISFSPIKKLNIYVQCTIDQFQSKGEVGDRKEDDEMEPNAYGALLAVNYTDKLGKGILSSYIEGVYTSPGIYLNSKYYNDNGIIRDEGSKNCWTQDFLVGYTVGGSAYCSDVAFSGFKYGPDAIAVAIGATYSVFNKYSVNARVMYMAHGEKGRGTKSENFNFTGINTVKDLNRMSPTGVVEHTFMISLEGNYKLNNFLSFDGGVAFSERWNHRNIAGNNIGNLQCYFGLSLTCNLSDILHLFKIDHI